MEKVRFFRTFFLYFRNKAYICNAIEMVLTITQGRRKQPTTYRGLIFFALYE